MSKETEQIEIAKREAQEAKKLADINITDRESFKEAVDVLSEVNRRGDRISELKDSIIKPFRESIKNAREQFRPYEDAVDEINESLKESMVEYRDMKAREYREKKETLEKRVQAGELSLDDAVDELEGEEMMPTTIEGEKGSVQFRQRLDFDIEEEDRIPRKYLKPDTKKIRKAVREGVSIPGVIPKTITSVANYRNND